MGSQGKPLGVGGAQISFGDIGAALQDYTAGTQIDLFTAETGGYGPINPLANVPKPNGAKESAASEWKGYVRWNRPVIGKIDYDFNINGVVTGTMRVSSNKDGYTPLLASGAKTRGTWKAPSIRIGDTISIKVTTSAGGDSAISVYAFYIPTGVGTYIVPSKLTTGGGTDASFVIQGDYDYTITGLVSIRQAVVDDTGTGTGVVPNLCLVEGTLVTLDTGEQVPVETLQVGQLLMSPIIDTLDDSNDNTELRKWSCKHLTETRVAAPILHIEQKEADTTVVINGGLLEGTPSHMQLYKREGLWRFDRIHTLQVGDYLYDTSSNEVEVVSVEINHEKRKIYPLELAPSHTYFANNILTHNVVRKY